MIFQQDSVSLSVALFCLFQRAANSQTQPRGDTQYNLNYSTALSAVPQQTRRERESVCVGSFSRHLFSPLLCCSTTHLQIVGPNTSLLINGDWQSIDTQTHTQQKTYCDCVTYMCFITLTTELQQMPMSIH